MKPIDPNDPGHRLAMLLSSRDREEMVEVGRRKDFKARMETLNLEIWKLRQHIITGQEELPLEPVPPPAPTEPPATESPAEQAAA
jgi:hypothetical protein